MTLYGLPTDDRAFGFEMHLMALTYPSKSLTSRLDGERIKALRLVASHATGEWFEGNDQLGAVLGRELSPRTMSSGHQRVFTPAPLRTCHGK